MIIASDIQSLSITLAAIGLAYIIASADLRMKFAVNGGFKRDHKMQNRLKKLDCVRTAITIADQSAKARRRSEPISPDIFGRRNIK